MATPRWARSATNRNEALSVREAESSTMRCRKKLYDALSVRTLTLACDPGVPVADDEVVRVADHRRGALPRPGRRLPRSRGWALKGPATGPPPGERGGGLHGPQGRQTAPRVSPLRAGGASPAPAPSPAWAIGPPRRRWV